MWKLLTIAILIIFTNLHISFSQPWNYNLGLGTGSFSTNNTASTTFLPLAPSGISRVRVGTGGGSFNLENAPNIIGSDTYLRISAPTGGSVNKFSIYDYTGGRTATIRFTIRFGSSDGSSNASSGIWYFFLGDGATYSDNNSFSGAQIFTGLQFTFSAGGSITTNLRSGNTWTTSGLTGTPFTQGNNYIVEIYANDSTYTQNYFYGTVQSVASNSWDLWINGILEGNDLPKALLANDVNIDSYMFYGINSTSNVANIFLDDIYFTNDYDDTPLPVTMNSFDLQSKVRDVKLNWSTSSEINNSGFDIERGLSAGAGAINWQKVGFVQGKGTTNQPVSYSYEDKELYTGQYYYRLKQVDYNGNFEYFSPSGNPLVNISKPAEFVMKQNYPNPSNPVSKIDYQLPYDGFVNLSVYDVTGKLVKELENGFKKADYYSAVFDGSNLSSGIYFYRVTGNFGDRIYTRSMKMILVK